MTPDRWRDIERMCQAALEREPTARSGFLDAACGSDKDLRAQVQSLLDEQARGDVLFETPIWAAAAEAFADLRRDAGSPRLEPGRRVGPFEIQRLIGAGGMGEVYRARDTRLGRTVAIKIVARDGAADAERHRRFEVEARAVSSLSHPHICALFDVGSHDGIDYLVMEHLEGETLAARLERMAASDSTSPALPFDQAIGIGIQTADALAAAHAKGIVHRDLKPANVMLTKAGVKLLDFGVAKFRHAAAALGDAQGAAQPATVMGAVLGTVNYMSPEQLRGEEATPRSDMFAFGALLYEMFTGTRAFPGKTPATVIAAVLDSNPPPASAVQPLTPPALDRLIHACLAKNPDERWDSGRLAAEELRGIAADARTNTRAVASRPAGGRSPARAGRSTARRFILAAGLVIAALILLISGRWLPNSGRADPAPTVFRGQWSIAPGEHLYAGTFPRSVRPFRSAAGPETTLDWSPDGRLLLFAAVSRSAATRRLYIRSVDGNQAFAVAGTEGANSGIFSADGRSVVFWMPSVSFAVPSTIRKVPVGGGPSMTLCDLWAEPTGFSLGEDGRLVVSVEGRLWQVKSPPGKLEALTPPNKGAARSTQVLPHLLPGDRAVIYTERQRLRTFGDEQIVVLSLVSNERKVLPLVNAADARYVTSGHLVYLTQGTLFAVPFDLERLEIHGKPVAVVSDVAQSLVSAGVVTGAGQFAVSRSGHLAYLTEPSPQFPQAEVFVADRQGRAMVLPIERRPYAPELAVSPDGNRFAMTAFTKTGLALLVYDMARATLDTVVQEGEVFSPRFTPDGRQLAFAWRHAGRMNLALSRLDGSPPTIVDAPLWFDPSSWTPGGRELVGTTPTERNPSERSIWAWSPGEARFRQVEPVVGPADYSPDVSPDGRWLAFDSEEAGQVQVFVQPYPGPGPRELVSSGSGVNPAWSPRGDELFYVTVPASPPVQVMRVAVGRQPDGTLRFGAPEPLFDVKDGEFHFCGPVRCFAVSPDARRFYGIRELDREQRNITEIHLAFNWLEELKIRVPTSR